MKNMAKKVWAFVNGAAPQHLAVLNEHKHHLPVGAEAQYRAVCGGDTSGQEMQQIDPGDARFACKDCAEQLKLWKEVQG